MTNECTTETEWLACFEARMRERGYPEENILKAVVNIEVDLEQSSRDAADDEMFDWDNE